MQLKYEFKLIILQKDKWGKLFTNSDFDIYSLKQYKINLTSHYSSDVWLSWWMSVFAYCTLYDYFYKLYEPTYLKEKTQKPKASKFSNHVEKRNMIELGETVGNISSIATDGFDSDTSENDMNQSY